MISPKDQFQTRTTTRLFVWNWSFGLVKDINLGYLKANFWIPLRRDEDKVEVAIDDPNSFHHPSYSFLSTTLDERVEEIFPPTLGLGLVSSIAKVILTLLIVVRSDMEKLRGVVLPAI